MLLGNYSVIHKSPGKFFGGTTVSNVSSNFLKNGQLRAIYSAESIPNQWGLPVGYYSGWMLPQTAGYVVAYSENQTSSTASPVMGVNGTGESSSVLEALAELSLVVSATGECNVVLTATGEILGAIYGLGTSEVSFTATGTIGANAFSTGISEILLSATATISALGHMTGEMTPFTELSPENLANAVWRSIVTKYENDDGTMGKMVIDAATAAAAGGSPLSTEEHDQLMKTLTLNKFIALK